MPIIQLEHLSKQYKTYRKQPGLLGSLKSLVHRETTLVDAVRDISFSIEEGELVGFIGPNGAGKTTTLKMLSGILWPTSGSARVLGHTPWERHHAFQRQFGIVMGAKNQLWWDLPARDTFLLNKEIYEIENSVFETRVKLLSETLGVSHILEIPVRKLSLGERMKCELVNSLLHEPRVLLLDEPTIGLDVVSQKAIRDFLKEWNKNQGTTMILTSHAMADVEALCDRVIVIDHGSLRFDGPLQKLVRDVADHKVITVIFDQPVEEQSLSSYGEILSFESVKVSIRIPRDRVREVSKRLLDKLPVSDILIQDVSMEEVVRDLFTRKEQ